MPISFEAIESEFSAAVRAFPDLANWRRKGKRCFVAQSGDLQYGVELTRFKGSFENLQWIGVCAFVSFPCPTKPSGYVPPDIWRNGRKFLRAYIVPQREMVDEPTFRSGAVIRLQEPADLKSWAQALPADLQRLLLPWINSTRSGYDDSGA